MSGLSRRRRSTTQVAAIVQSENLEQRTMLDASGAIAEAAGFDQFESREQLSEHLIQQALDRYENQFGKPSWGGVFREIDGFGPIALTVDSASGASGTNVQVGGVDEADIFENDGKNLYLIQSGDVVIVDATDPEDLTELAALEIEGDANAMFLHEGTLTLISTSWDEIPRSSAWLIDYFYWGSQSTHVTTYDVSDPSDPTLVEQTKIEGNYIDARSIDGRVHVFTSNQVALPEPRRVPIESDDSETTDETDDGVILSRSLVDRLSYQPTDQYEERDTYEAWLRENIDEFVDDALPEYEMVDADGVSVSGFVSDFDEIAVSETHDSSSLLSVITIDPASDQSGLAGSTSVFTQAYGNRYATRDHLYFGNTVYDGGDTKTQILQFSWATEDSNIQLVGSGEVNGVLLNQFSMDEHDGYLRVATTTREWSTGERITANNVFVLQNVDGALTTVGAIENFEEGESIFAVRFSGERAFVVTFEQIDPLFMIDLSDPTAPQITGELEVPGFSNYIQRIDDDHILAIGRIDSTTKVTVYDISDATDPTLVDEDVLPAWTTTEASYDHHAFGWYPAHSTLALPISNYRSENGRRSELIMFEIDPSQDDKESVIQHRGSVESDSSVRRSTYIADTLFTITTDSVIATDFTGEDQFDKLQTSIEEPAPPRILRPRIFLAANGTSFWQPLIGMTGLENTEDSETVIALPASDAENPVEVTVFGDTLTVKSESGEEVLEISKGTDLRISGTADADNVVIDLGDGSPDLLGSLKIELGEGDDTTKVVDIGFLNMAQVYGNAGDDVISAVEEFTGRLRMFGGEGNDSLTGAHGNDTMFGGKGDDELRGGAGHDRLVGQLGLDRIWGQDGSDTITGGRSDDKLYGGRGNDLLRGGRGNDRVFGSNGADRLFGNEGDDRVFGNDGNDLLLDVLEATANDVFAGGSGQDRFVRGLRTVETVLDRLFDFRENEDILAEVWNA